MNDVIRDTVASHNKQAAKLEWRVLVVDKVTMKMVSACTKMHELSVEGITIVETIEKRRTPMPSMEAIYLIQPSQTSVKLLLQDFTNLNNNNYKAAHVYFTEVCPDERFQDICNSVASMFIKTLKEINIAFIPYESEVFSLDNPDYLQLYYSPIRASERKWRRDGMEKMAEQVATLCSSLGEYPSIRYRADFNRNLELAQLVQLKLDDLKVNDPNMGEGPDKAKTQLIILDRGFDINTTLLHETTFQAMAFDLFEIHNDVYKYETGEGNIKEVILDESDDLWVDLRHQHFPEVSQNVAKKLKKFSAEQKIESEGVKSDMRQLGQKIKKVPQQQKEKANLEAHLHLAEECMNKYNSNIGKLCKVEQDLSMGTDAEGERIKDPMRVIVPILLDQNASLNDKIRIILLYIQSQNGISEENLSKLIQHAQIPPEKTSILRNMSTLGVRVVTDEDTEEVWQMKPKQRAGETYQMARWTPLIKDIVEDAIENKLDKNHFPYLCGQRQGSNNKQAHTSVRYGAWYKDKKEQSLTRTTPRIICFVVGGTTFSEMRVAYEVTQEKRNWEVIMGGTHIITPESFLENVTNVRNIGGEEE